jgi:hypothetical protein
MTEAEWDVLTVEMLALWPNREISDKSFDLWFRDLGEFKAEQVEAAILALYRDGREWAPNGAQIRLKLLELRTDVISHGEAYRLTLDAAGPMGGYANGMTWLREQSPLAADAAEQYGWRDFCLSENTPDTTRRAQYRDIFQQVVKRAADREKYRGLKSGGLEAIEAANGPGRFGELVRLTEDQS